MCDREEDQNKDTWTPSEDKSARTKKWQINFRGDPLMWKGIQGQAVYYMKNEHGSYRYSVLIMLMQ